MPFAVMELIEMQQRPVTVLSTDTVQKAVDEMVVHDFSQLPVVDQQSRALGLITGDSILKAVSHFSVKLDALRVSDAMMKVRLYQDIENTLKDRIRAAFTSPDGQFDEGAIRAAILNVTSRHKDF